MRKLSGNAALDSLVWGLEDAREKKRTHRRQAADFRLAAITEDKRAEHLERGEAQITEALLALGHEVPPEILTNEEIADGFTLQK